MCRKNIRDIRNRINKTINFIKMKNNNTWNNIEELVEELKLNNLYISEYNKNYIKVTNSLVNITCIVSIDKSFNEVSISNIEFK